MKIESQGEIQVCIFKRFSLKRKKKLSASIVLYLHRNYSGTCVFKEVAISCEFFYKSFLAAVDGNPATPAMNNLQYLDPSE